MAIDKSPVLVGTHPTKLLPVYRTFLEFKASRSTESIVVFYSEHLLNNEVEIEKKEPLVYLVRNIKAGEYVNNSEIPLEEDFNGFDNWFNFDVGQYPNGTTLAQIIIGAINATLQGIPIDAPYGFVITQSE